MIEDPSTSIGTTLEDNGQASDVWKFDFSFDSDSLGPQIRFDADGNATSSDDLEKVTGPPPVAQEDSDIIPSHVKERPQQDHLPEIHGTKLKFLVGCLFIALFLSTLEQFIIGVALTHISSELGGYRMSSWVVTAYLASYNSFLMVFARASDIFGRRIVFLTALAIFVIASLACGLANTMIQLIVFRAFQGIGGAGLYTLPLNVSTEIAGPVRKIINILVPTAFGLGSGVAPLIGGAIVTNTTWRWVFLLNVPFGFVIFVIAFIVFPPSIIHIERRFSGLLRIDWLGVFLLIGSVEVLSFGLQEGGTRYNWSSSVIICTIVFSAVSGILFFVWEWFLTNNEAKFQILPIWPSRLWNSRVKATSLFAAFFCGFPLFASYIYLPERFEIIDGLTPLMAGVCLLPMPVISFWGTGITSAVCLSKNVAWYCFAAGATLQAIGLGLSSTAGINKPGSIPHSLFAYEIITGIGIGTCLSAITFLLRQEFSHLDHSVCMSAISSVRTIGGTISIAVGHVIISHRITAQNSGLAGMLTPAQIASLSRDPTSLSGFTPQQAALVVQTLQHAFKTLWQAMCGFALGALLFGLLSWVRNPVDLKEKDRRELEEKRRLEELSKARADATSQDVLLPNHA